MGEVKFLLVEEIKLPDNLAGTSLQLEGRSVTVVFNPKSSLKMFQPQTDLPAVVQCLVSEKGATRERVAVEQTRERALYTVGAAHGLTTLVNNYRKRAPYTLPAGT